MEITIYTNTERMTLSHLHGTNIFNLSAFLTDAVWNHRDMVAVDVNGQRVFSVFNLPELRNGAKKNAVVDRICAIVGAIEKANVFLPKEVRA